MDKSKRKQHYKRKGLEGFGKGHSRSVLHRKSARRERDSKEGLMSQVQCRNTYVVKSAPSADGSTDICLSYDFYDLIFSVRFHEMSLLHMDGDSISVYKIIWKH